MNTYVVCLIFLCALGVANSACPSSWTLHGGRCYKVLTTAANRAAQKTACEGDGGYLAEPQSKSVFDFIKSKITVTSFLGYTDTATDGTWVGGNSGKSLGAFTTYTNWAPGEPNNYGSGEACMEMYTSGKWNDISCIRSRQAVCEKCQTGFTSNGGKCYQAFSGKKNNADAKAACEALGAFLAEPLSETENGYVKDLMKDIGTSYTGFNDKATEGTWVRNTNSANVVYTNWHTNEPSNARRGQADEDCSEMYTSGKWNDIFCTNQRAYVCEA